MGEIQLFQYRIMNVEVVQVVVIHFNPEVIGTLIDIRYFVVVKTV
jgi:hypothetical protein